MAVHDVTLLVTWVVSSSETNGSGLYAGVPNWGIRSERLRSWHGTVGKH